ncbi:carboxylesterase family protein, partial [Parvibaculum sp.]|uniref:carboxylesterase family protein n=1 Tax=Parvibaculum sp. TaxID=2024848 RepID=UPI002BA4B896
PDCVTIFGESAGAHAIGLLMASPLAHGLFHRAIGQSGAWWDSEHGPLASAEEASARGLALMRKLGAADIEDMRAMPASRVNVAGAWNFLTDPGVTAFSPSVDGYVLPDVPGRIFAQGKQTPVPLLAGWNRDEHAYFTSRGLPTTGPRFRAAAARQFGAARMADFDTVYPSRDRREARRSADMLIGDLVISQQIWSWGGAHRAKGAPAYLYEFHYASAFSPRPVHTADIPFVFGNLTENAFRAKGAAPEAGDRAFSRLMRLYWINFSRAGDPNGEGLPRWPLYEGAGSNVMHLSRNSAAAPETVAARFAFIESFRKEGVLPADWRAVKARMSPGVARLVAGLVRLAARCRRLPGR